MIEALKYITGFCLWLFLALLAMCLCALGIYTLAIIIVSMRKHK